MVDGSCSTSSSFGGSTPQAERAPRRASAVIEGKEGDGSRWRGVRQAQESQATTRNLARSLLASGALW